MKNKFKLFVASLLIVFSSSSVLLPAFSTADSLNGDACAGLNALKNGNTDNKKCDSTSKSQLNHLVSFVVQTISWVLGIAAVIVVIISGFRYITSAGDTAKVSSAKQTLIYALVGLVVAVLAQVLVHFVINGTSKAIK